MASPTSSSAPDSGPRKPVLWLFTVLALVIAGLGLIDRFLEGVEAAELRASAERSYRAGQNLVARGRAQDAIEPLRSAHGLERSNRQYDLALITALMQAGRTEEADPLMDEVLGGDPNDGMANLAAARLRAKEGEIADAEAHYHRAIFGEWGKDAAARRTAARIELVHFLAAHRQQQELLAELISLEAESPRDPVIRQELAHLFLIAASPARAASAWQGLVNEDPRNSAYWAGLGEAELEAGEYPRARHALEQAVTLDPAAAAVRANLKIVETVTELDPTPRALSSAEKFRRSVRILELARNDLAGCTAGNPKQPNPDLLRGADGLLGEKPPAHTTNEDAERILDMAEQLWSARAKVCGSAPQDDAALRLIMGKLAG